MVQRKRRSALVGLPLLVLMWCCLVAIPGLPAPWTSADGTVSHDVRPGAAVDELRWLSDYLPDLEGTPGDTPVYVLRGAEPGGTALILGGTHPGEMAGVLSAVLLVERAEAVRGTLIVVPHANNSASRVNAEYIVTFRGEERSVYPFDGSWISLTNASGDARWFHYGSRFTQPEDQGAEDPDAYVHASGFENPGYEARNLDRVHPGRADGTLTERISYALFQLVEQEAVDVVIDMHESSPASSLAHTLICHPKATDIGAMALFDLELDGVYLKLEISRPEHAGISHWEFGENTDVLSFLTETPNPGQDWSLALPELARHPGAESEGEPETPPVAEAKPEVDVINDPVNPLSNRVHEQLSVVRAILANHALFCPSDQAIEFEFPFALAELVNADLGSFLR